MAGATDRLDLLGPAGSRGGRLSDNVLTGRAFAARNLVVGFLHGFPVSSSGSRTAIGDAQGSRTQLHSLVAVVPVVVVLVVGDAVLAGFPAAALGAVVVYASLQLIDLPVQET